MRIIKFVCAAAASTFFYTSPAVSADICADLLAQGIRDTSSQQITEARFNELKANVCNSNYDSYSKAASQAMSGGFDLPGIFGISFGSANANQEYSTKWSNFCSSNYGLAMANSEMKSYFSTANRAVLNSFDNCVNNTSERFIRYVEPQSDGRTFAIVFNNRRQGNPAFRIVKISLTNSTTGQPMNLKQSCDFDHDLPWSTAPLNAISIVCRKEPDTKVVVAGTTDAGNIDPVEVQAVPSPPPSVLDRVAALEGIAQNLRHLIDLASESGDVVISKSDLATFQADHKDDGSVWKLCNGDAGTLNMTGRYPRGAGPNIPAPGAQQEQSIQNHSHRLDGWGEMGDARGGGDNHVLRTGYGGATQTSGVIEPGVASGETRPATTVVNFFCRVH